MIRSSDTYQPLPQTVKALRLARGISQLDLSRRLRNRGVELSTRLISQWERGQREIHFDTAMLTQLADALRCSAADLVKPPTDAS